MLLNILQCTGRPQTKNYLTQNVNRTGIEKPHLKWMQFMVHKLYLNKVDLKKKRFGDFSCGPVVKTALPLQGAQVQSLVRELRSRMLRGAAKKKILITK